MTVSQEELLEQEVLGAIDDAIKAGDGQFAAEIAVSQRIVPIMDIANHLNQEREKADPFPQLNWINALRGLVEIVQDERPSHVVETLSIADMNTLDHIHHQLELTRGR